MNTYYHSAAQKDSATTPAVYEVPPNKIQNSDSKIMRGRKRAYGGTVLSTYITALMPVMRIASRPTHPASGELDHQLETQS